LQLVAVKVALVTVVLVVVEMPTVKVAVVANFLKVIMEAVLEHRLQALAAVQAAQEVAVETVLVPQAAQAAQEQHLQLLEHL
jgi:hypothetical protein